MTSIDLRIDRLSLPAGQLVDTRQLTSALATALGARGDPDAAPPPRLTPLEQVVVSRVTAAVREAVADR